MSRKKGLSHDEKRQRLLELMMEKNEFFQLKELEKLGPKEKGITSQSVKEVLQSLVDDGMVDSEKIGTLTCFWAFPSKANNQKKRKLLNLEAQLEESEIKKRQLEDSLVEMRQGKEETGERDELMTELTSLEGRKSDLTKQLANYTENDPEKIEKMQIEAEMSKEAVNRWTDNILSARKWCAKHFGADEKELNKQLGIPSDFDYMD